MVVEKQNTIEEIISQNIKAAKIFEYFGLDFCKSKKKTIESVCFENGLKISEVIKKLENIDYFNKASIHYDNWDLDFLTDFIVNNHHRYIYNSIPSIEQYLYKVKSKKGDKYPELTVIDTLFSELKNEILIHLAKEEKMLFPYFKKLSYAMKNSEEISVPPFGSVNNPIKVMEAEHINADSIIKQIRRLTKDFTPPEDECTTFKLLYYELKEFNKDLEIHIYLENNVLFPVANKIENKIINKN
jgi:regulator of cell morphogenesis and NO signaling